MTHLGLPISARPSTRACAPPGGRPSPPGLVARPRAGALVVALAAAAILVGCGGTPSAPRTDEVFYLHGGGIIDRNASYEVYFPPLDAVATERVPRLVGVGLLNGDVRMSRPIDWYIRSADYTAESRFISYQSPRQFLFSIYERIDDPEDPWPDLLKRYEEDLEDQGARVIAGRAPVATANTQGRSYLLKAKVPSKPAYDAFAHEILIRSAHRVLLVQVVHQQNIEATSDEIMAALGSLIVY